MPSTFSRRALLRQASLPVLLTTLGTTAPLALHAQATGRTPGTTALPRIITINGALTEVVYALGAQAQLVGTDTSSLYPEAALRTPKVGYMRQLSAEGVLALKPDTVIATTEAGPPVVIDQLRSAGVHIELVPTTFTWEDVRTKVQSIGRAARQEAAAQALQARLDEQWLQVSTKIAADTRPKPKVLFILSHGPSPQVSGTGTAGDAMIRLSGGVNALSSFKGYRPMTPEAMASAAPDVILTTDQGLQSMGGEAKFWLRPELALTPAFKRRKLVSLDALLLLGFGPRMPEAVHEVHARLHA